MSLFKSITPICAVQCSLLLIAHHLAQGGIGARLTIPSTSPGRKESSRPSSVFHLDHAVVADPLARASRLTRQQADEAVEPRTVPHSEGQKRAYDVEPQGFDLIKRLQGRDLIRRLPCRQCPRAWVPQGGA